MDNLFLVSATIFASYCCQDQSTPREARLRQWHIADACQFPGWSNVATCVGGVTARRVGCFLQPWIQVPELLFNKQVAAILYFHVRIMLLVQDRMLLWPIHTTLTVKAWRCRQKLRWITSPRPCAASLCALCAVRSAAKKSSRCHGDFVLYKLGQTWESRENLVSLDQLVWISDNQQKFEDVQATILQVH